MLGGISTGAFTACGPSGVSKPLLQADAVYGNDHHVTAVGYYHAPYRGWYPLPYNHYDPQRRQYFHGGQWTPQPHASIVNLSEPRADALQAALLLLQQQSQSAAIRRSGFGSTSRSFFPSS